MEALRSQISRRAVHLGLIVLIAFPLFAINARWGIEGNADAIAAALPAFQLAETGSMDVSDNRVFLAHADDWLRNWFVELPTGEVVSNRPPGLIALAVPSYFLIRQGAFSLGPSTLISVLVTTLAIGLVWNVLQHLVGLNRATIGALVLAFGTTTWEVSSSQLWPHGPGQLWAALAITGLAVGSVSGAGLAFAASITTRPLTAVSAAITGILESLRNRSWAPVLSIGAYSSIGLAVVLAYNRVVFGNWSVRGGYSRNVTVGAVEGFDSFGYLANVFQMFLGLPHGVFVTTPIVGISVIGAILIWRRIPGWAKSTALAGLGYLLVHAALNRASGGTPAFYRYPLEPLVLAAPALVLGAVHLWDRSRRWKMVTGAAIFVSVGLQIWFAAYIK